MSIKEKDFFGKNQADNYDDNWKTLKPITNALHLLIEIHLQSLPSNSKILCVGAGTGAEILTLASTFPEWRFTALDSSSAMLEVCKKNIEEAGVSDRCDFHLGYVKSLPEAQAFDAATSILVSQFLTDVEQRIEFYRQIKNRLKSGSYLFSADLATQGDNTNYDALMESWTKMQLYTGLSAERAKASTSAWGTAVSVASTKEIEKIIRAGGFEEAVLFYQTLFIHAWYAKVP